MLTILDPGLYHALKAVVNYILCPLPIVGKDLDPEVVKAAEYLKQLLR
jgi:hypothetical protein